MSCAKKKGDDCPQVKRAKARAARMQKRKSIKGTSLPNGKRSRTINGVKYRF